MFNKNRFFICFKYWNNAIAESVRRLMINPTEGRRFNMILRRKTNNIVNSDDINLSVRIASLKICSIYHPNGVTIFDLDKLNIFFEN